MTPLNHSRWSDLAEEACDHLVESSIHGGWRQSTGPRIQMVVKHCQLIRNDQNPPYFDLGLSKIKIYQDTQTKPFFIEGHLWSAQVHRVDGWLFTTRFPGRCCMWSDVGCCQVACLVLGVWWWNEKYRSCWLWIWNNNGDHLMVQRRKILPQTIIGGTCFVPWVLG